MWVSVCHMWSHLRDQALTFKLTKTHLNVPSATIHGHMVEATGRYPSAEKVTAIIKPKRRQQPHTITPQILL